MLFHAGLPLLPGGYVGVDRWRESLVELAVPLMTRIIAVNAPLTRFPEGTPFVPCNLSPTLREAKDAIPSLSAEGCHRGYDSTDGSPCRFGSDEAPVIALVGDSHAAHWFPGLKRWAESAGFALQTYTKSACPAADVVPLRDGSPYVACSRWRAEVVRRLRAAPPALALLASYGGASVEDARGFDAASTDGLSRTIGSLAPGGPVVVLADTPNLGETPASCLSAHLGSAEACGRDLTDYLCSADFCLPIIGSTLVHRDAHHLTPDFSERLAPILGEAITALIGCPGSAFPRGGGGPMPCR